LAAAACADLGTGPIERGLMAARQPGCLERFDNVILDGAHTTTSVNATILAIADHFPRKKPQLVFALAQDKDVDGIAGLLAPDVQQVFCTRVDPHRGRSAEELAEHPAWRERACAVPDAATALKQARAAAGPRGLVLATGSLYLAGALRRLV
jgi:folylpolyglutamate synthase/dihydropteroate synthase